MVVNTLNGTKLLILSTELFQNSHGLCVSCFTLVDLTQFQLFNVKAKLQQQKPNNLLRKTYLSKPELLLGGTSGHVVACTWHKARVSSLPDSETCQDPLKFSLWEWKSLCWPFRRVTAQMKGQQTSRLLLITSSCCNTCCHPQLVVFSLRKM